VFEERLITNSVQLLIDKLPEIDENVNAFLPTGRDFSRSMPYVL
jgi:hypothetical protein